DRRIDEAWIRFLQNLVAEPQTRHHGRTKVFDDDIGSLDEAQECLRPGIALEIEHERALAAVPTLESERRHAEWIAARRLDLDDVRAEIGEQHRTERTGDEARQVQDADACQRR